MDNTIKVSVVRHSQKGRTCYVGHMTAAESAKLTFADSYPPDASANRLGYQRPPDEKRAQAFGEYLQTEGGFMTPILLNARGELRFVPSADGSDIGHIELPPVQFIAKVDGQHRGIGVEKYAGDQAYPVPFMMFENLDTEDEQELFITINREQKKVSMSHVYFVGRDDDELSELVTRLESDPSSPWFHRVNLIGAKGLGRSVSLQSLRDGLDALFSTGPVKALSREEKYQVALQFWRTVAEIWPTAWNNPRRHLLTKSIGMIALSQLGGDLVPLCIKNSATQPFQVLDAADLADYLRKAVDVDWASDGDFRGIAGRGGAKVVKDRLDALIFPRS